MNDALSQLVESGLLAEETRVSIQEAWDQKVKENREYVTAELREEFAQKYNHDKEQIVEAMDKLMTESLSQEIVKFVEDRKELDKEKQAYTARITEDAQKLESFVESKLSAELEEFHADRQSVHGQVEKLEEFVVNALAKEIKEFAEDKQAVVETRVKLVAEAKQQMDQIKKDFITKSAKLVEEAVNKKLTEEISQLQEDISSARQQNFGRQIFEAFASEYQNSYLNEKSETSKLLKVVDETTLKLENAEKAIEEKQAMIESKERELAIQKDLMERKETMANLLKPLSKEKADVMNQLLESTQTEKLKSAFDKYLPAVMNDDAPVASAKAQVITESEGNRASRAEREDAELTNIRLLAGLNK